VGLAAWLWREPWTLTVCYLVLSAVVLRQWHSRRDLIFYLVPAILGPLGEAICVYFGAWEYSQSSWLLPPWLPLGWGISVLFIYRITISVAPRNE